jgi:hypothetical protein
MDQTQILSILALSISIAGSILAVINHKRIRSNCCGRRVEASLDVESTISVPSPKKDTADRDVISSQADSVRGQTTGPAPVPNDTP